FTDPKKISIAYFEASLLIDHLVTTYGDAGLHKLLRAYGQGLDTPGALKAGLNTSFDELQGDFDKTTEKMFGSMRRALAAPKDLDFDQLTLNGLRKLADENPGSFPIQMAYGRELQKTGGDANLDEAMKVYARAAALMPLPAGHDS